MPKGCPGTVPTFSTMVVLVSPFFHRPYLSTQTSPGEWVWMLQTCLFASLGIFTVLTKMGVPGNRICKFNLPSCH